MNQSKPDKSVNSGVIPSLSRQRLADQIADVMREQMLTGVLKPGMPIHERETSKALGVSRTPLREAILILEAEGLIETAPARSPLVADPSLVDLTQLLVVQATLEELAGKLACANATEADIHTIRQLNEDMKRSDTAEDTVQHFKTDMAFHEAIVASTRNKPLIKTHKQYNTRLWRARYISSRLRRGRDITAAHHQMMVEFLENRDPEKMAQVMRQHLENTVVNITKNAQDEVLGTEI